MPADLPREKDTYAGQLDEPIPAPDDPGGSHAKGYSADPGPAVPVPDEDPIPLAPGPAPPVHRPQQEAVGRNEPGSYSPNERVMGSDR